MQRQHRLKKSAEFQRVRALKQSWAHPLLVLYAAAGEGAVTRVGISASKRTGKAVTRNRIKRLIREAVRRFLPDMPAGQDLVFVARPAAAEASYQQVSEAVERLLRRARLLAGRQTAGSKQVSILHTEGPAAPPGAGQAGGAESEPNGQ